MNNIVALLRTALPVVLGAIFVWFVLAGIFALSLFVILPLVLVFAAIGAFFYWRYKKMLTSASVGEVGNALQAIEPDETGLVQFNRQVQIGGTMQHANINVVCKAQTPVQAGETVCVEEVKGKEILVKRMGV